MLKKLRNKLLFINLVTISIVMIIALGAIYILIISTIHGLDEKRLESIPPDVMTNAMLSERENSEAETDTDPNLNPNNERGLGLSDNFVFVNPEGDLPIDYSKVFIINVDQSSGMLSAFSRLGLTENQYVKAASTVIRSGVESGKIHLANKMWLFKVTGNNSDSIVFLDVTDTHRSVTKLLIYMTSLAVIIIAIIWLLSLKIANRALAPVESNLAKQRAFVADASHELKTPLAIIDSNADALLSSPEDTVESQRIWIDRIEAESGRMRKLVENLLYLAKSEDAALEISDIDLNETLTRGITRIEASLFEKNIHVAFRKYSNGPLIVRSDAGLIDRLFMTLLENAVKYTNEGGEVTVDAGRSGRGGRTCYIRVSNTGDGIVAEDLPNVFDRFFRGDKSRSSETSGYGLGLSIAKTIADRLGGNLSVASTDGLTTFTFELPVK